MENQIEANETHENKSSMDKMKAIKFLQIPSRRSKDLIGVEFDIVDAIKQKIKDNDVITFVLHLKKEKIDVVCSKSLNHFSETYFDYFQNSGQKVEPLNGYTFVEIEGGQSGNKPIVFREI